MRRHEDERIKIIRAIYILQRMMFHNIPPAEFINFYKIAHKIPNPHTIRFNLKKCRNDCTLNIDKSVSQIGKIYM